MGDKDPREYVQVNNPVEYIEQYVSMAECEEIHQLYFNDGLKNGLVAAVKWLRNNHAAYGNAEKYYLGLIASKNIVETIVGIQPRKEPAFKTITIKSIARDPRSVENLRKASAILLANGIEFDYRESNEIYG